MKATAGIVAAFVLSCSVTALGQSATRPRTVTGPPIEYGSPSELKGVTRIYVDTGASIREQQEIVKSLRKSIPSLDIVRNPDDAEVILVYRVVVYTYPTVTATSTTTVSPNGSSQTTSQAGPQTEQRTIGLVEKPLGPNRVRLLMEYDVDKSTTTEKLRIPVTILLPISSVVPLGSRSPERDRFLWQFVKAWKTANGIK